MFYKNNFFIFAYKLKKSRNMVRIIRKVSITDTLRTLSPGESHRFTCGQLGSYSSASSAVCRLNKAAARTEYEIETSDSGKSYTVTRNRFTSRGSCQSSCRRSC